MKYRRIYSSVDPLTDLCPRMHHVSLETLSVQSRSGLVALVFTQQYQPRITVELRNYQRVLRGGGCLGGGGRNSPVHQVLGSERLRLRTHRLCGRSRPLKSAVVEYQAPSVAVPANSSVPKLKRSSADFRMLFQTSQKLNRICSNILAQLCDRNY